MGTVLVSAAVVVREGRVLLTRRQDGAHLGGMWELPGGKVEAGEDPRDALVRECREECGIDLRPGAILEVAFHRYPEKDVLLLFFECTFAAGVQEVRNIGVADHVWCPVADLDRYPMPPPDQCLAALLRKRAGGSA